MAAHLRTNSGLLDRGATTTAQWIGDGGANVPRGLRDRQALCTEGDVDAVLLALEAMSEHAHGLRVSHPLVDILNDGEGAAMLARSNEPVASISLNIGTRSPAS